MLLSHGNSRDCQIRDGHTFRTWVHRIACMVPCDICKVTNALVNITYVRRHRVHRVRCGFLSAITGAWLHAAAVFTWRETDCLQPVSWVCSPPAPNKPVLAQFLSPQPDYVEIFDASPQYCLFVPVSYEGVKNTKIVAVSAGEVKLVERETSNREIQRSVKKQHS